MFSICFKYAFNYFVFKHAETIGMGGVRAIPLSQLQAHIRETTLPAGAGARTMEDCSGKHPPSWERSPTELTRMDLWLE